MVKYNIFKRIRSAYLTCIPKRHLDFLSSLKDKTKQNPQITFFHTNKFTILVKLHKVQENKFWKKRINTKFRQT